MRVKYNTWTTSLHNELHMFWGRAQRRLTSGTRGARGRSLYSTSDQSMYGSGWPSFRKISTKYVSWGSCMSWRFKYLCISGRSMIHSSSDRCNGQNVHLPRAKCGWKLALASKENWVTRQLACKFKNSNIINGLNQIRKPMYTIQRSSNEGKTGIFSSVKNIPSWVALFSRTPCGDTYVEKFPRHTAKMYFYFGHLFQYRFLN